MNIDIPHQRTYSQNTDIDRVLSTDKMITGPNLHARGLSYKNIMEELQNAFSDSDSFSMNDIGPKRRENKNVKKRRK